MAEEIVVRKAEARDIEVLADYVARLKQVNEELDPMYITREDLEETAREYIEKSLEDPNTVLLVAEKNGKVVGMVRATILDRVFYEPRLEGLVTDIYIHPSHRRRNIAGLLLEKLAETLRERGVELLAAEYPPGNRIAERFFEKHGFKPLLVRVYKKI